MDEAGYEAFVSNLERDLGTIDVERFETIGPVIGEELRKRTLQALVLGVIGIIIYIAWAFRRVSRPVPSWQYGLAAIIALVHDVVITIGVFAALGYWLGVEVGAPFVAALLTILGYSVNDTIVVFDRVREHLLDKEQARRLSFGQLVSVASRRSVTRSVNVSLTTLLVLLAIFFFGGSSIQYFVLALIIGVTVGTYSSLFLASPLLVIFAQKRRA
jgi:preprotein translocase subunit SecF